MYELARRHFPKTYLDLLKLRMPTYVKLVLTNEFPRSQLTTHLGRAPPGGAHAASAEKATIVNPAHLPAAEADRDCLKCHLNQPTHIGRIQSSHAKNEVSCTACHSIHRNGPNGLVPRRMATINEQCASCHTAVWAE